MFYKILLVTLLNAISIESDIFNVDPKLFAINPSCVQLNETFYSYVNTILRNLNRRYLRSLTLNNTKIL